MRHPQTVDGGRTCRVAAQVKDTPVQRQMCGGGIPAQVSSWHIATNRRALNFRSLSGVLRTWMGERPSLRPARSTRYNSTQNFGPYSHAKSKKTQKFVFRSALRPNQISFRTAKTQSGHCCLGAIRKTKSAPYRLARISTSRSTYRHSAVLRSRRTNSSKASACSGASRTKSESRMALQVLGCDADVSLRPAGIPYQSQCAEIAPRRWLGVHLALSPTKLLSSGSE